MSFCLYVSLNNQRITKIPVNPNITILEFKAEIQRTFELPSTNFDVYEGIAKLRDYDKISAVLKDGGTIDARDGTQSTGAAADTKTGQDRIAELENIVAEERRKAAEERREAATKVQGLTSELLRRELKSNLSSLAAKSHKAVYSSLEERSNFERDVDVHDILRDLPEVNHGLVVAAWTKLKYTFPEAGSLELAFQEVLNLCVMSILSKKPIKDMRYSAKKSVPGAASDDTVEKYPDGNILLQSATTKGWDATILPMEVETNEHSKVREGLGQAWSYTNLAASARVNMMKEDEQLEVVCHGIFTNIETLVVLTVNGPRFLQSVSMEFLPRVKPVQPTVGFNALARLLFSNAHQLGLRYSPLETIAVGPHKLPVIEVFQSNATRMIASCLFGGEPAVCKQRKGPGDMHRINSEADALRKLVSVKSLPRLLFASEDSLVTKPVGTPLRRCDADSLKKNVVKIVFAIVENLRDAATLGYCHGDIHNDNVVLLLSSALYAMLIDWECMIKCGQLLPPSTGRRSFISTRRLLECASGQKLSPFEFRDDLEAVAYVFLALDKQMTWNDSTSIAKVVEARGENRNPIYRDILKFSTQEVDYNNVLAYLTRQM